MPLSSRKVFTIIIYSGHKLPFSSVPSSKPTNSIDCSSNEVNKTSSSLFGWISIKCFYYKKQTPVDLTWTRQLSRLTKVTSLLPSFWIKFAVKNDELSLFLSLALYSWSWICYMQSLVVVIPSLAVVSRIIHCLIDFDEQMTV